MLPYQAPFILAVDIGTSSVKAIVFDSRGRKTNASAAASYQLRAPEKGAAVLDPEDVVTAVVNSCRETIAKSREIRLGKIEAVGLSGFWHSLVAVGEDNKPLTPLYTWADTRSNSHSLRLRKTLDDAHVHKRTGCPIHFIYLPAKILWLLEKDKIH